MRGSNESERQPACQLFPGLRLCRKPCRGQSWWASNGRGDAPGTVWIRARYMGTSW